MIFFRIREYFRLSSKIVPSRRVNRDNLVTVAQASFALQ